MGFLRALFGGGNDDEGFGGAAPADLDDEVDSEDGWGFGAVIIYCVNGCTHYARHVKGYDTETRYANMRRYLAGQGWTFEPGRDICPDCSDGEDDYGVGEVEIICDRGCGTTFRGDFTGDNTEARFAAARDYLRNQGWLSISLTDVCPTCFGPRR